MQTVSPGQARRRGQVVSVKPDRIRQARLEAGLTAAQLGGSDLSRVSIFKLETGRSKPRMATLQLIARRTNKPLSFFLAEHPTQSHIGELEQIEEATAFGRWQEAYDAAGRILAGEPTESTKARAHLAAAWTLIKLRQVDDALPHARAARVYYEFSGDLLRLAESYDREAVCLYITEQPEAAGRFALALEVCRRMDPVPFELESEILSHIGSYYASIHDWERCERFSREAVEVTGKIQSARQLAFHYNDLAIAVLNRGDNLQSAVYARRALSLAELSDDIASVARTECNLGCALRRQGKLSEAREHLVESFRLATKVGLEHGRVNIALDMAELEMAAGQLQAATYWLQEAEELATRLEERISLAICQRYRGELAELHGDQRACDNYFRTCFQRLAGLPHVGEIEAEARSSYARILETRGDIHAAYEQMQAVVSIGRPHLSRERALEAAVGS